MVKTKKHDDFDLGKKVKEMKIEIGPSLKEEINGFNPELQKEFIETMLNISEMTLGELLEASEFVDMKELKENDPDLYEKIFKGIRKGRQEKNDN